MNIKKITICAILLLAIGLLSSPVCLAADGEVTDVERHVPETISAGELTEIKLDITREKPFIAGVVETIPPGFTFPNNDEDISDAEHFKVDRDAGKISFNVIDENEITYNVISSEGDSGGFEGYWVDMLFQTQELNEGKERWTPVTDPNAAANTHSSGPSSDTESTASQTPGFGTFLTLMSLVAGLFVFGKHNSGGDQE
jgi:hypothetical protein